MDMLNLWKRENINRSVVFLYSQMRNRAWMCTLTIHDGYNSYSYTGRTTLFIGTRLNTKSKARDMAISIFSSEIQFQTVKSWSVCQLDRRVLIKPQPSPSRCKKVDQLKNTYSKLDGPLFPDRKYETEDEGVDDVKIIKRSLLEERCLKQQLDKELEEYWNKQT